MAKKVKKANGRKSLILFGFIVALIISGLMVAYFQFMKNQQLLEVGKEPATETEKLIAKDLSRFTLTLPYSPIVAKCAIRPTSTETMKLWGRYNQCIYNSSLSEEEFSSLLSQLREMYSSELISNNPEENHKSKLQTDVDTYKEKKWKIVNYSAETGQAVEYKTINGKECAYLHISYFIKQDKAYSKLHQKFIMVKEDNKWKILGWQSESETKSSKKEATSENGA